MLNIAPGARMVPPRSRWFGDNQYRVMGIAMAIASLVVGSVAAPSGASASAPSSATVDPAAEVNPFIGTGVGSGSTGAIGTFPGADVPFGMVQWSPDTPTTSMTDAVSGGYFYTLDTINGFSLTHLSGAGCPALEDFPVMPFAGTVTSSPGTDSTRFTSTFSHRSETASPGYYEVTLGDGVKVALTVTDRTGIGTFTFPAGVTPSILVDPEASDGGFTNGSLSVEGNDALSGTAVAGKFCGTPGTYSVHLAAEFETPFHSFGTWEGGDLSPGGRRVSGTAPGVYATFPAAAHGPTTITMKVGLSYSSTADAAGNLRAEEHGWDFDAVRAAAAADWNRLLSRITVHGGTGARRTVFYTALYHSLMFPSLLSDDDGDYPGLDGHVHTATGFAQYSNISGWDIYRTQVPLLAVLDPKVADGLVQSLVRDADQDGGQLPRWQLVDVSTDVMGGDSADPIIASAYAFGAKGFDTSTALAAMVHGADTSTTPPGQAHGYVERPGLSGYLAHGYVPTNTAQVAGETFSVSGDMTSLTLEYAVDDFAVAKLAGALGQQSTEAKFMARSANWQKVFDSATGLMAPRGATGAEPAGWPTGSFTTADNLAAHGITGVGQLGFQEGNANQYTWMVPQDLAGLVTDLGGPAAATAKLEKFFTQLNAGSTAPYEWAGDEENMGTPYVADYAGSPWLTEQTTTAILDQLYPDNPVGEPGNDDLGAMSSWAVWSMLGLYPETPGTGVLVTTTPVFSSADVTLSNGHHLTVDAARTKPGAEYISEIKVDGKPSERPWLPASALTTGATIDEDLVAQPDHDWGNAPADAPPSYGAQSPAGPLHHHAKRDAGHSRAG